MDSTTTSAVPSQGSRVKVAIRCRPAIKLELEDTSAKFVGIVKTVDHQSGLGSIILTHVSGKSREFIYDHAFGPESDQDCIFEAIARPVIDDFLGGKNGTLFAYGQTGTGKTYTMGVLEFVTNEDAGIIPRTISRIFEYADEEAAQGSASVKVTLSFLQLYRETIQDLLAPIASEGKSQNNDAAAEVNLNIREDPLKGFYVEGLQEFEVNSYSEAELLVNLGLENRAIASTLMNASSSRSHTVLTLYVEIHQKKSNRRAARSKLMLVDLAGSERVRRSEGQGVRLAEAKSINSSLSALGNVIAALAGRNLETHGQGRTHIPYRDTKLTKLLQDSLGGSASTALIATVGPSAVNYSETLSTLQFASRCMSVRGVAVTPSTYIDYEWMCGELREEVSMLESALARQEQVSATQTAVYDATIRQLYGDLVQSRNQGGETSPRGGSLVELFDFKKLEILIDHLSAAASTSQVDDTNVNDWFRDTDSDEDGDYLSSKSNSRPTSIVRGEMDLENIYPEEIKIEGCNNIFSNSDCNERAKIRQMEVTGMALQDPLKIEHAVKPVLSDTQETYLSTETDDTPLNTDTATIQPRVQSLSEPSKYYAHATILNPATLQKAVELNEVKSDTAAPHDVHSIPQAVSPDTTSSSRGNSRFSRTCSSDGLRSGLQSTERVSDSGRTSRGGVSGAITPSEASSILNRIASLPLDQIARMSPTAREQVLLIRSQLLGGDKVLETRGGEQSGDHSPILDVQPSRRHSSYVGKSENNFYDPNLSKSSDADRKPQPHRRPSHWQHRYRKFEEEENLISSERDMD